MTDFVPLRRLGRHLAVGLSLTSLWVCPLRSSGVETVALVNGTLIDGRGGAAIPDAVVVIEGERVRAVGSRRAVAIPAGARTLDLRGATVLPGFINAHVHSRLREESLRAWASAGVTTVRDLGGERSFSTRDALARDRRNARLLVAGPLITVPGGYPAVPFGSRDVLPVSSPADARNKAAELLEEGADILKLALESGAVFGLSIPTLSAAEADAVVAVAHERGARVSAHVTVSADLRRALDARVDDVAHMVVDALPDDLIARMVHQQVTWVPTLELWHCVGHGLEQAATENLRRFVRAGGSVALGTDYDGYTCRFDPGLPLRELAWMAASGMTPKEIILAGTRNAARVCGRERDLGTLEPGKVADVLVVEGDPLADIGALANVRLVLRSGTVVRDERVAGKSTRAGGSPAYITSAAAPSSGERTLRSKYTSLRAIRSPSMTTRSIPSASTCGPPSARRKLARHSIAAASRPAIGNASRSDQLMVQARNSFVR